METAIHQLGRQLYQLFSPALLVQASAGNEAERKKLLELAHNLSISLWEQYGAACKKKTQTLCIHTTQSYAVYLVDLLDTYQQQLRQKRIKEKELSVLLAFYQSIQAALLGLLDLIEHSFHQDYNREQKMPHCLAKETAARFGEQLTRMDQVSEELLDRDIKTFTCACLRQHCLSELRNYGTHAYLEELLLALLLPANLHTESWLGLLIRYNFNDTEWVDRLLQYFIDRRDLLETDEAKKECWETVRLGINKLQPLPNKTLVPAQKTCKELLLDAIHSEEAQFASLLAPAAENTKPFETSLSVSQLGLFLRLQVDTQILQTDNKNELIRQIAARYRTSRVTHISHENLHKKFYTCDPAAISIMRTHLANMMNCLKKYG